jgi:hypothetical protein
MKIFHLILKPKFNALNFPIPGFLKHRYRKKRGGLPENEAATGHVGRGFLLA